ncbi:MAG: 50S ribosomal protein L11 methyltransferase [Clostridium sp.]
MDGKWIEVRVITKSEALEPISGIFYGLDCKGVAIEDPNDILGREQGPLTWDFADINILEHKGEAAVVKAYFSEEDNMENVLSYVEEKINELKEMGLDLGEAKVEHEEMFEEDWANNWKKYYKPTKVGEKIVVKPIWEEYKEENGELVVNLDPGMAFGTGTHETTRMCIQALERYVEKDSTVFDVGCGSGILAIAAAKLGAKKAVGVDLDPVAVESSLENVKYNDLNNIEVLYGNLVEVIEGKADIVVANIIAEIICILCGDVQKVLKQGGYFITSGIIHDRVEMVTDKLNETGFEVLEVNKDGEWNCIVAKLK